MANPHEKIYLNDSRKVVRKKLHIDDSSYDEDFSLFEAACKNIFNFKCDFNAEAMWATQENTLVAAQEMIWQRCREQNLKLGNLDVVGELAEWRLYNLHKAAKWKVARARA